VLVGHLTFSCLGDVPTWLNEGLAVYSEGELDTPSQRQLEDAIRDDTLLSVRSLSGSFSEVSDKAYLSYSQSYSITKFLIETSGQDKMTALLLALRDGMTIDDALIQTYGFNIEGLEDAWRQAIGAQPRSVPAQPTAQPTPTNIPTIVPVSGAPMAQQSTPTVIPTSSFDSTPATEIPARTAPPLGLSLVLLGICCIMLSLIGVLILGVVVSRQNRTEGENG
jgi:peptidase MA superfamily protein